MIYLSVGGTIAIIVLVVAALVLAFLAVSYVKAPPDTAISSQDQSSKRC